MKDIKNNLLKFQTAFNHMPKESEQTAQIFEPVFTELWPIFIEIFKNYQVLVSRVFSLNFKA